MFASLMKTQASAWIFPRRLAAPANATHLAVYFRSFSIYAGADRETHHPRIRLWCINASKSSRLCRGEGGLQYRCGARTANDLDAFIARRLVSRLPISLDQYGRAVATCSVGDVDCLVRNWLALDWAHYSKGRYDATADAAEALKTLHGTVFACRGQAVVLE
jgi:endonuclease YncB( thermonuclease family)